MGPAVSQNTEELQSKSIKHGVPTNTNAGEKE
jgi:hypothetical protein